MDTPPFQAYQHCADAVGDAANKPITTVASRAAFSAILASFGFESLWVHRISPLSFMMTSFWSLVVATVEVERRRVVVVGLCFVPGGRMVVPSPGAFP